MTTSTDTIDQAHTEALELNKAITDGAADGPNYLDCNDKLRTDTELAEAISRRIELLDAAISVETHDKHSIGMVRAHAWWLALYRAEQHRRSRSAVVVAYMDGLVAGLKAQGQQVPATDVLKAAVLDLLHGEAREEHRARGFDVLQDNGVATLTLEPLPS